MSNLIQIVGYSSTDKVPGYYAETVYGAGAISAGSIPLKLLLCGTKTSSGTATADQDVDQILSVDDADDLYGPGSELAIMCYGALQIPGVRIYGAPVAEAGGAAAGVATITITGTWSDAGTFIYRIDGILVTGGIASTDAITDVADTIVAAVNANTRLSVTAAKGAGPGYVVTLTRKSKGARGNQGVLYQDISQLPSGMTSTIAGGTALTGGLVPFHNGSGTDSVSNVLALIDTTQYDRIAAAQNDATNAALWETHVNTCAGVLVGILQHLVFANNASLSASTSIAQTTLNAERAEYLWYLNSETIPSFIAATFAAYRTSVEQDNPGASYDDYVLPGVMPQSQQADWPSHATLVSALDNSITPIKTSPTGEAMIVRAITTKSLTGSNPDYSTLDTSDATTPDYVRMSIGLYYTSVFKPANPKVNSDPATGQRDRPAGVATPTRWTQAVTGSVLKPLEAALIITDVDENPMVSEYNTVAKRLMSIVPVVPTPNDHAVGVSVRQVG